MTEFNYNCRVYYEDTDCGGVVYHANYLKFMERARSEWLYSLNFGEQVLRKYRIGFAIKSAEIDFHYPARLGEELRVTCKIERVEKVSVVFLQQVLDKETDRLLAEAKVHVVCINDKFKPCVLPEPLQNVLSSEEEVAI